MPKTLITPEGKAVVVPDDEVAAKKRLGYTDETTREAASRSTTEQIKSDSSTFAGKGQALLAGAARGVTLGMSDVALANTGDEDIVRRLRNVREANPTISTVGEVGGGLGLALATGGGSAAAEGGASTARVIAGQALRGAAEGAAQNTGMYLSDVALGNKQLSAEGFLASAGEGAAFGGAAGGGLAAAEKGMVAARKLFPKFKVNEAAVKEAADNVDVEVQKALATGEASVKTAKDQLELMRMQNLELDTAAKQRVLEKRAAEAAKAQAAADLQAQKLATQKQLDDIRIERAKQPKTYRPGSGGQTRSPVGQSTEDVIEGGATAAPKAAKPGGLVDADGKPALSWREFTGQRMGKYMKSEGGHGPAIKKIGEEWQAYKATLKPAGEAAEGAATATAAKAPTYESIAKGEVIDAEIPAEALANRIELPGAGNDAVKAQKARDLVGREPLRTDVDQPIRLAVHPDGRYEVVDGRNRIAAAIEQGKPIRAKVERAYVPDDVVGPPIGNVAPGAGGDLEALLGQSVSRVRAGEDIGALAKEAKVPTALDEIHEAMAELDPNAARIVEAVKANEAAAANMQRRFKVRAPQEIGGSTTAQIADAPNLTLGRVKQMYEKANEAERTALLDAIGPEKAKALEAIVEGKATFTKWYKNKGHWWDDPSYGPLPTKAGPSPDDLGEFADMTAAASTADDDLAHVMSMSRAADDISAYERSVHDLANVLGPAAPPDAAEMAARYAQAVDDQARKASDRMAQVLDDAPMPVNFPEGSGPMRAAEEPPIARSGYGALEQPLPMGQRTETGALFDTLARREPGWSPPRVVEEAAKKAAKGATREKASGLLGMLADVGAVGETLQAVGVAVPFMPDVDKIPVIGPILGAYLKLRAGMTVLGRAGFKIPLTGEARVAAGAAKTRERVAQAMDRILEVGAKGARAARPAVAATAWRAPDVLKSVLFDDGQKRKPKDIHETVRARSEELLAATENPAAVQQSVRASLPDVRDPDVIAAVAEVKQRQVEYLAKHAPMPPPPSMLNRSKVVYSPAEIESFARRVRAANDPVSVLDDVRTGRITPEGAETLREVYPQLYAEAQERLMQQSMMLNRSLPHANVVRLSVLFNVPLASTLEPDAVAQIQAAGAQPPPPATPTPGGLTPSPSGGAPQVASLFMTPGEKRASR